MEGMPLFLYNMTEDERKAYYSAQNTQTLNDLVCIWIKENHEYISFCILVFFIGFITGIFIPILLM